MKRIISLLLISAIFFGNDLLASKVAFSTVSENMKEPIELVVVDQSVNYVLEQLADAADVNFVQSEETKLVKISLALKDIPLKEALDLIIRATDLSYQILDNSIIVATPEKINREIGLTTSVFDLQYAKALDVKELLSDISKKVQIDKSGNRIIYQADPKVAKEIEKVLTRVDRPQPQVLFKARIKEVTLSSDDSYGIEWGKISNYTTTLREGSVVDWGDWTVDDDGEWDFVYDGFSAPVRDISGDHSDMGPEFKRPFGYESQTSSLFNPVWHRVVSQEYALSLDFKMSNGDAAIIAEPEIAVSNNTTAKVHIGEIFPYSVTTIEQGTAKTSVMKEETGIKLSVTPIINEENDITVEIDAEVSSIIDWKGPDDAYPLVKVRKATTTVRVRDGQTIKIGGMILEDDTYTIQKLPLLGQIPYIGVLFQHHKKIKKKTNLIIEITPYIMIDGEIIIDDEEFEDEEFDQDDEE